MYSSQDLIKIISANHNTDIRNDLKLKKKQIFGVDTVRRVLEFWHLYNSKYKMDWWIVANNFNG